jgi:predicted dehydrogenase
MGRTVRLGVVGLGSVSEKYVPHIRSLNLEGNDCQVVIGCDIRPEKAERARAWDIPAFTTDHAEVMHHPEVDAVVILTDMQNHGGLTREALTAGKHVLVEKPMSMDLADAAELVALARTSKGHLVCAPHVTLSPTYQAMWRHIHAGDIGRPLSARGLYGWAGPDWDQFFYEPGGGPMFDLGVYNVTTLTGLIGPAKRVVAMTGIAIPERVVANKHITVRAEDNFQILLDFGDQCFGAITTGFTIQRYDVAGVEIYGTEGTINMLNDDWDPRGYKLWRNSDGFWQDHEERNRWRWTDGIRDLIQAIREGRKPVNSPEHAYHVLEIMVKSMESGRLGQALPIQSTFTPPRFDRVGDRVAPHREHAPRT